LLKRDWRRLTSREFRGSPKLRAWFLVRSFTHRHLLAPFLRAPVGSSLHRHLQERPETAGVLIWPYQCAAWDAKQRIDRIAFHFAALDRAPDCFRLDVDDKLVLLHLTTYSEGASVVLDQPKWLSREGHFTLSVFVDRHRAYTLTFSLHEHEAGIALFVGGLQGRSSEGALELYKRLTKDLHGMRPRDFLLEVLRMLAPVLGASRIFAVAEGYRFFRHSYFNAPADEKMNVDYDEIWADRGGRRVAPTHFELPIEPTRWDLLEVASNKRAMYRKRIAMLEDFSRRLGSLQDIRHLRFDAA
jgi:uncharacterized protein VirK/YbjX